MVVYGTAEERAHVHRLVVLASLNPTELNVLRTFPEMEQRQNDVREG